MEIMYIITYIFFIYSFLRIKKSNKKLNILLWLVLSIVTYMGFNSLTIYLLHLINIRATLLIRSIINIVLSIIMIIKTKNKQEYCFDKFDFGALILLLYVTLIIFIIRFGFKFDLNFEITDASFHYAFAKKFANMNTILDNIEVFFCGTLSSSKYLSYTNAGTFLELLRPITGNIDMYKSFIIFEMISFYLSTILLYFIVRKDNMSAKKILLCVLFTIMYALGYPLLNLLYGFHYWGVVLVVMSTIIVAIQELDKNNMYNSKIMIFLLSILSYSVLIAYYPYVPVVYLSLGLYFIYLWKWKKTINLKQTIIYIIIILIIPFIYGGFYYGFFNVLIDSNYLKNTVINHFTIEGSNYKNILGNFIYIIPIIIYSIINEIKKHKINIMTIFAIIHFLYIVVLFILCITGLLSSYYFAKLYNFAWLIAYAYLIKEAITNKELLFKIYMISYIIIVFLSCLKIESIIKSKNYDISTNNIISYLGDVYDNNIKYITEKNPIITNDISDAISHIEKNIDTYKNSRGEIPIRTSYFRKLWIARMLDVVPTSNYILSSQLRGDNIKSIETDKETEYFVWILDKEHYDDLDLNNYDIIYKNDSVLILKKHNK